MSTRPNPSAATILISHWWTPEQALAVFELLNELRDMVWASRADASLAYAATMVGYSGGTP